MKRIAIFASGNGSNAEDIIRYFRENEVRAEVVLVVCNNREAGVLQRSRDLGVATEVMSRDEINNPAEMLGVLERYAVDAIVLAGFLLMIPSFLTGHYAGKIINIHPSLLPKYGGKGMYGRHVHEAVVAAGETETGITIHLVNERFDDGRILFQAHTPISPGDTPADVERKIHILEQQHFPRVIAENLLG